ncbi:quercetin dioxygenase-like cupin family protein [Paraburkholderia sp. GAS199]|uniref:cupin domain-containing protein n=1 Tax=Paraburkholderia sp. GAS199 TaxID=3035126 RepID=UPI003D1F56CC
MNVTGSLNTSRIGLPVLAAFLLAIGPAAPRAAIQWITTLCSATNGAVLNAAGTDGEAVSRPRTTQRVLACEPLPNVPGKSITTMIVDFPPRAYTPAHRHPGSVTAVVLQGTVRSQMEGTPAAVYAAGQTWFEPPRALHLFAENPDPAHSARLLATFVADTGCGALVLPPDAG